MSEEVEQFCQEPRDASRRADRVQPTGDRHPPPPRARPALSSSLSDMSAANVTGVRSRPNPQFTPAIEALNAWRDDVQHARSPTFWRVGTGGLAQLEIGPGLVTLLGGAPGAGKTAFAMQLVVDALRLTPTLRALVCNVEMPPEVLLDRQLSRLSGVDLKVIRYREFAEEHADPIDDGIHTLESVADRLAFCRPPFDLANVAASADAFRADLLVLDYIQRILPPGQHADKRVSVNATMDYVRRFADAKCGLLVIAAVGRTKDSRGRTSYDGEGLNLASFRESSELEFGADDAFILVADPKNPAAVTAKHLKSRHTEARDLKLTFDRTIQRFKPMPLEAEPDHREGRLRRKNFVE